MNKLTRTVLRNKMRNQTIMVDKRVKDDKTGKIEVKQVETKVGNRYLGRVWKQYRKDLEALEGVYKDKRAKVRIENYKDFDKFESAADAVKVAFQRDYKRLQEKYFGV